MKKLKKMEFQQNFWSNASEVICGILIGQLPRLRKKQRCFKKTWGKWKGIALKNGVDREVFTNRVRSLGWAEEEAAMTPKGCRTNKRWTAEELKIAKENGVDGDSMKLPYTRVRLGWSREDAVGTPRMTTEQRLERVKAGVENRRTNREFNRKNRAMGN